MFGFAVSGYGREDLGIAVDHDEQRQTVAADEMIHVVEDLFRGRVELAERHALLECRIERVVEYLEHVHLR